MAFSSDNLKVLLAVLDHGSFSAAARHLGKVPSAVSMTIAQLEAELDLVLFDRSGREPRPTEAARALEPQARQVASQMRQLQAHALSLHQGLEQRLSIAIAPELLYGPWNQPLAKLATEFPALEVEVLSAPQADALRMLHEGCVQLALVFERPAADEREAFQELSSEILLAVVAPGHPLQQSTQLLRDSDLLNSRQIVIASRGDEHHDPRLRIGRQIWRTDSHLASLALVQAGLGWAFLPQGLDTPLAKSGALHVLSLENMSNQLRLWVDMVWSRERPLGLGASRFIALLQQGSHDAWKSA